MNKDIFNAVRQFLHKNSSWILTGLGCAGVVGTAVIAVKQDRKAYADIFYKESESGELLSKKEKRLTYVRYQIPTVLVGIGTVACVVGAQGINQRTQVGLMSAYGLISESFSDYRRKNIELYGSENHKHILDELAIENAKKVDIYSMGAFSSPDLGGSALSENYPKELFYDEFSKRYFTSTLPAVIDAQYNINRNIVLGGVVLLNDWYAFLGLEQTMEGNELGWYMCDDYMWVDFSNEKSKLEDGTEYIRVIMDFEPTMDWQNEI